MRKKFCFKQLQRLIRQFSSVLLTKIEKSAGKPVIHGNRIANVRLYQGLKAYEGI